jgi:L-lactate permease
LEEEEFVEVSKKAGVALSISAFLVMPTMVLTILCPFKIIRQNIIFVLCSLGSVMLPTLAMSFFTYEFPSLIGGMLGCVITAGLIRFRVGLKEYNHDHVDEERHLKISTTSENSLVASIQRDQAVSPFSHAACDFEEGEIEDLMENIEVQRGDGEKKNVGEEAQETVHVSNCANGSTNNHQEQEAAPTVPTTNDQNENNDEAANKESIRSYVSFVPHLSHTPDEQDELLASLNDVERALGPRKSYSEGYLRELLGRTFPLWGVVVLLILTRVQQIGLKPLLTKRDPYFEIDFGTYGKFRLSASLVFQLLDILQHPALSWKYELLYVPFVVPFLLVSIVTMAIYRKDLQASPKQIFATCANRLLNPAVALMGALALVQLLIKEGSAAPADIIGTVLSQALKQGWIVFAALIGTLGSFFSGSTTISNLTFGGIQEIAAESIGTSVTSMLALQATGASAGNGVCLNNIISACTVVGLGVSEGKIIAKTFKPVLATNILATVVMLAFFFRF